LARELLDQFGRGFAEPCGFPVTNKEYLYSEDAMFGGPADRADRPQPARIGVKGVMLGG
jgi:hypothetical protein